MAQNLYRCMAEHQISITVKTYMIMTKNRMLFFMLCLTLFSCRVTRIAEKETPVSVYIDTYVIEPLQGGSGEKYFRETNLLELIFWNDTICSFKHTFFCDDIDEKYRIIEQRCRYFKKDSMIIVENLQYSGSEELYIEIPIQNSKKCKFLSEMGRAVIPTAYSPYNRFGRTVPNITIDTLYHSSTKPDRLILDSKNSIEVLEDGRIIYIGGIYGEFDKVVSGKKKKK